MAPQDSQKHDWQKVKQKSLNKSIRNYYSNKNEKPKLFSKFEIIILEMRYLSWKQKQYLANQKLPLWAQFNKFCPSGGISLFDFSKLLPRISKI